MSYRIMIMEYNKAIYGLNDYIIEVHMIGQVMNEYV